MQETNIAQDREYAIDNYRIITATETKKTITELYKEE